MYGVGSSGWRTGTPSREEWICWPHIKIEGVLTRQKWCATLWAPGLQFSVSPNSQLFNFHDFRWIEISMYSTRNGSQHPPFCPGSPQNTFIIFFDMAKPFVVSKWFSQNRTSRTFENLEIPKPRFTNKCPQLTNIRKSGRQQKTENAIWGGVGRDFFYCAGPRRHFTGMGRRGVWGLWRRSRPWPLKTASWQHFLPNQLQWPPRVATLLPGHLLVNLGKWVSRCLRFSDFRCFRLSMLWTYFEENKMGLKCRRKKCSGETLGKTDGFDCHF